MGKAVDFVGLKYNEGYRSAADIYGYMADNFEKEVADQYKDLLYSAYAGIDELYNPTLEVGGKENVNDSTDGLAERTGEGDNQDPVGGYDENGEPGRGNGQGVQQAGTEVRTQDGLRVPDSGTASSGEAGNSGVQRNQSNDRTGSTGNTQLSGSVVDSYSGSDGLDRGRGSKRTTSSQDGRNNEGNSLKTEKEEKAKAGSLEESIERDLPMLLPEQVMDVAFTETAFKNNEDSTGVMVTNGTGTGKLVQRSMKHFTLYGT